MIVKTSEEKSHCADLKETVDSVKRYNMRVNPTKFSFGIHVTNFIDIC